MRVKTQKLVVAALVHLLVCLANVLAVLTCFLMGYWSQA